MFDKNKAINYKQHAKYRKKIPLQRYWTSRYVFTLAIGLIVVAIISAIWIRHHTFENRIQMMQFMAKETAKQIVEENPAADEDSLLQNVEVRRFLEAPGRYMQMNSDPSIYIVNMHGDVVYSNASEKGVRRQLNPDILYQEDNVKTFDSEPDHKTLYMVKSPVTSGGSLVGWVVFLEFKNNLNKVNQEYKQLFIMISALALLGLLAIYFLSKQLAKPITDVAAAAELIKEGQYSFDLSDNVREKEVYELIRSFKEMAARLDNLETLRTELLAGVTHELKTPVTSISGLLQAMKDGIVEGEEAEEFLNISIEESEKMKRMVEDLLAFNTFVAGDVPLHMEVLDVHTTISKIVRDWEVTQQTPVKVNINLLKDNHHFEVDHVRLQQILVNLMNNGLHAMASLQEKSLKIDLHIDQDFILIDVLDQGTGISERDQPYIFERFYRGENKKFQTSGFGLGLPFSKMIAQALQGDLELLQSNNKGTTFRLYLPSK